MEIVYLHLLATPNGLEYLSLRGNGCILLFKTNKITLGQRSHNKSTTIQPPLNLENMMLRNISTTLPSCFALTLLVLACTTTYAQPPMPQPTKEHQALKHDVGSWDAKIKLWVSPDAAPMTGTGTETCRMMGPMWLVSEFKGEVMGFSFTGHGQNGYDPTKKKYIGTWIDTSTPYLNTLEGTIDESGKVLTVLAKGTDPITKKMKTTKMVTTIIDHDHKNFVLYMPVEGEKDQWVKHMAIEYTRAAKDAPKKESLE